MSGVLILIEGNELSAQSKVTLISPVGLKVKLKTISGLRMPTDWQFTSIITITVTYQRKSDGWKSNRYLRYFHLVGLAEAKENPYVWLERSRRCSIWYVRVSFCGFLVFLSFFRISEIQPRSAREDIQKQQSVNTFIVGFTVFFRLIVCFFFLE